MNLEIIKMLAEFRNKLLYENRYFNTNDRFLSKLSEIINNDVSSSNSVFVTTLQKNQIIYRARVIKDDENKYAYAREMMKQSTNELISINDCENCEKANQCVCEKPSIETVHDFKKLPNGNSRINHYQAQMNRILMDMVKRLVLSHPHQWQTIPLI